VLRDIAVFLSDDGRHALITDWSTDDDPPYALLALDGQINEEAFDHVGIERYLSENEVLH